MADAHKLPTDIAKDLSGDRNLKHVETREKNPLPSTEGDNFF